MADFNHLYGSGFKHGQVRTDGDEVFDIDAIINIEGDPSQDETEIKGDDTIKASFASGRKEDLTITANAVSMDVLQAITGNSLSSSAGGSEIPVGTVTEMNPPFIELSGDITVRTDENTSGVLRRVWHKVQIKSVKVNAGNGSELSVELTGTAVQADKTITGVALNPARVYTLKVIAD